MKAGKAYEHFVFEKFKRFFRDFDVKMNDKIIGKISKIKREIDVSIKGKKDNVELLYLIQCKDHKKPANITIIGEFSSVIKDVGASKGFLICSSGFAKTIHHYALSLGIELITVEDINSVKWKVEIEIPVIYIKKIGQVKISARITANNELVKKNKESIQLTDKDFEELSLDGGTSIINLFDYLNQKIESEKIKISETDHMILSDPTLMLRFSGIWVSAIFDVQFFISEIYFLKYLHPDTYSQINDHIRNKILPLDLLIKELSTNFDESYIEIDKDNIPIFTNFNFKIEESLIPLKKQAMIELSAKKI